jgi:hypothetical protein
MCLFVAKFLMSVEGFDEVPIFCAGVADDAGLLAAFIEI